MKQKEKNSYGLVVGWALLLGGLGLLLAYGLMFSFPQRPDGDLTALAQFEAQYGHDNGRSPLHQVRDALWLNIAGALFAWGGFYHFLHAGMCMFNRSPSGSPKTTEVVTTISKTTTIGWAILLIWSGLLLMWGGWAWNQTRGWQGELFLEADLPTPLGVDRVPVVTFERFLLPPAPDGAGRALALRLMVDDERYQISEANPYKRAGWTLRPRWYGVTATSNAFHQPLFFGESGALQAALRGGGVATVTLNLETLAVTSLPPLDDVEVAYHAIIYARFAPGERLQWIGGVMMLVGAAGSRARIARK